MTKTTLRVLVLLAGATALAPPPRAAAEAAAPESTHVPSAAAGATKVVACTACHGPNGNSVSPIWPALAGQNAAYLIEQLTLFRAGTRWNPIMSPQAQAIASADDVADIAAYFAAQTPTGGEADPSYWKDGEQLYRGGDRARNIPACVACHGPVGVGNPAGGYPALRGQQAAYTVAQLTAYASDSRYKDEAGKIGTSPNGSWMLAIAKRLTPEDMRNVASYTRGMR
jgi:cytochrome c553